MKTKTPDALLAAEVSRRGLMKTTAIGGLAMASSAFTLPFTRIVLLRKCYKQMTKFLFLSWNIILISFHGRKLAGKRVLS